MVLVEITSVSAVAAAPAPTILKPTDPWNIDYSDEMRQFSPDITFYLTLASSRF